MKKLILLGLILVLSLCSCSGNQSEEEPLNIGQSADFAFGSFTISAFKRDGKTFYFSIKITPKNSGSNTLDFDEFYYYIGDSENKINVESIQLSGSDYQNVYSVTSDKTAEISALSLEYEEVEAKWNINTNLDNGGDVNFIDTTLAQMKAQQEKLIKQQQQREAQRKEERNVGYAWQAVAQYGEQMYPYGFKLHYILDKLAEEKRSDGTWFLKAGCDVTNMYDAKMSGICEAVVQGSGENWEILSFNVY